MFSFCVFVVAFFFVSGLVSELRVRSFKTPSCISLSIIFLHFVCSMQTSRKVQ
eukprot:m.14234 g.14234  ORF g.14234 m.14234 type:complete len:53 (-) comp6363_c0_seq2:85-243(-)